MKILCTICARSGSKEVKNKNIILHGKKILIDYTIDQARKSKIFDKIVVSTDSAKIKRLTRENVDFVIKRPKFCPIIVLQKCQRLNTLFKNLK